MKSIHQLAVIALATFALTAFGADTATNWTDHCAKCHGADGKGDTKMGHKLSIGDLTDAKMQAKFTDDEAFKAIKVGLTDANGKTTMKAIEGLSEEDMKALVAFVRTLKK